jgi:cbb3-type cytochrome oxidase subunit 3
MLKRSMVRTPICIVLSLLLLVDFAVFAPAPAQALDKKSVLIGAGAGAVAGAGIVLAAPAIAGAVGAAGGIAGIGTAIAGGIAAAGGAIIGVVAAVGGAVAAGVGAIAGWVAGIIASPLFIPALIVIAAVAIGYYLYRRHKKKQAEGAAQEVLPGSDQITVTPGDYDMNPVMPPMNQAGPVTIGDQDAIVIQGDAVTISDTPPVSVSAPQTPTTTVTTPAAEPVTVSAPSAQTIEEAHKRYLTAYQKYTSLVTTGGSGDVRQALSEYQAAYREYMNLKAQQGK